MTRSTSNTPTLHPSRSPRENLAALRRDRKVYFTNTGPRDTGQSDFKNRHTLFDLIQLAPLYNQAGYFSIENHGGARFHQNLMQNKIDPFEEARLWKERMPDVLTQTLVRSTNLWGYRMYPRNVIARSVRAFLPTVDVWRCFDFLNYVPNMVPIAEAVMAGGKIFEPAISFTASDDCTNDYYLGVTKAILAITGGPDEIILCIKDMAGVGSPKRTASLIDALLQKYPDLIIHYHRHATDGLAVPSLAAAAKAGARILDVTDDPFSRYYGHAPVRPVNALLLEQGLETSLRLDAVDQASEIIADFIGSYEGFESQVKGFSYKVTEHKMPGGAFPSSFEQAVKGGFLDLMPAILKGMSLGNRVIKYFDVTPGSQIRWTSWAGIIQYHFKEGGYKAVEHLLDVYGRFVAGGQSLEAMTPEERDLLLGLYTRATDDLKGLLLGRYGPLPFGWPADWVYESVFGETWQETVRQERMEASPLARKPDENIEQIKLNLEGQLGRSTSEEELVLFLQHPASTLDFFTFRSRFGNTTVLPTKVWFEGLHGAGSEVNFDTRGKPNTIRLVSIGQEVEGFKHLVLSVNNTMHVFPVEMPAHRALQQAGPRFAQAGVPGEIGAPMMGNVWRIGGKDRRLKAGDIVKSGEEVLNIEAMKIECAVLAPMDGVITEIAVKLNDSVIEHQLLMILGEAPDSKRKSRARKT
jgi:pyruvate carboxylase